MPFPYYKQLNAMDCDKTCLRMATKYDGKYYNTDSLPQKKSFNKHGFTLLGISEAVQKIGFRTRGVVIEYKQLFLYNIPHTGNIFSFYLKNLKKEKGGNEK